MSKNTVINNVYDLAQEFGITSNARDTQHGFVELLSSKLFRHTDAGLGLSSLTQDGKYFHADTNHQVFGVAVNGIVEGTDIEASIKLLFPFTSEEFWNTTQVVSDQLDDAKAEWDAQADDLDDDQ